MAVAGLAALVALGVVLRMIRTHRDGGTVRATWEVMGTYWTVEVDAHGNSKGAREALDRARQALVRLDALMSEWRAGTPVSQINAAAGKSAVETPEELRQLIERSLRYSEISGGAFDITWRGMGGVWRLDDAFTVPLREAVEAARRNVGYRGVQVSGNRVGLARAGMAIGLGGIGKGYASDRVSLLLWEAGFRDHLVAGAGDIRVSGTRMGKPWRLGIQDPRRERGELLGRVALRSGALSTSGDYERYRMVNGIRYHHIVDPRTGYPANQAIAVSVIAPWAEQADALATSIFILGPVEGLELARAQKVEALVVGPDGRQHMTEGFRGVFERVVE